MKKRITLVLTLLTFVLVGCNTIPSADSSSNQVSSKKALEYTDFEESETAVYMSRIFRRAELHQKYKSKLKEDDGNQKYIDVMNEEFGEEYYRLATINGKPDWDFNTNGWKYFRGIDVDAVRDWLDTNPFGLSEAEDEAEKEAFEDAYQGNAKSKVRDYYIMMKVDEKFSVATLDRLSKEGRSLSDVNASVKSGPYVRNGQATDAYWNWRDEQLRKLEVFFVDSLTDDEREVYDDFLIIDDEYEDYTEEEIEEFVSENDEYPGDVSDIEFVQEIIATEYTPGHDYVAVMKRDFKVKNPRTGNYRSGSLYMIVKKEYGHYQVVDKFVY